MGYIKKPFKIVGGIHHPWSNNKEFKPQGGDYYVDDDYNVISLNNNSIIKPKNKELVIKNKSYKDFKYDVYYIITTDFVFGYSIFIYYNEKFVDKIKFGYKKIIDIDELCFRIEQAIERFLKRKALFTCPLIYKVWLDELIEKINKK